jgi:hypothetical protein
MSGILTRLLFIAGLLAGAVLHGSIAAAAMDGCAVAGMAGMDAAGCAKSEHGKMKPMECVAICAIATADIAPVASLSRPVVRTSWRLADRSADGLRPPPDPTPPRV